jgi:membrane protein required for colicin V production
MNVLISVIIIAILIGFCIDGIRRGLVRQIFEIIGIIAAFVSAYYLGHYMAMRFEGTVRLPFKIMLIVTAAIVFIAIVVVFHLIGRLLQKIASISVLGPVDRVGGGVFGALKGVLFISLLCTMIFALPFPNGVKTKLHNNPAAARIYPVLPRLYNFFISRVSSAPHYKDVARAGMELGGPVSAAEREREVG